EDGIRDFHVTGVQTCALPILSRTDSTASMIVWLLFFLALGAGLLAWPDWVPIRRADAWVIVGLGLAGAIGQYALTEAFRTGEARSEERRVGKERRARGSADV